MQLIQISMQSKPEDIDQVRYTMAHAQAVDVGASNGCCRWLQTDMWMCIANTTNPASIRDLDAM